MIVKEAANIRKNLLHILYLLRQQDRFDVFEELNITEIFKKQNFVQEICFDYVSEPTLYYRSLFAEGLC